MHDSGFWGGWGHYFPGFGHGLYGLLISVLFIAVVVGLIRALLRKKD